MNDYSYLIGRQVQDFLNFGMTIHYPVYFLTDGNFVFSGKECVGKNLTGRKVLKVKDEYFQLELNASNWHKISDFMKGEGNDIPTEWNWYEEKKPVNASMDDSHVVENRNMTDAFKERYYELALADAMKLRKDLLSIIGCNADKSEYKDMDYDTFLSYFAGRLEIYKDIRRKRMEENRKNAMNIFDLGFDIFSAVRENEKNIVSFNIKDNKIEILFKPE